MLLKESYSKEYMEKMFLKYCATYNDVICDEYDRFTLAAFLNEGYDHYEVPCEISQMYHEYNMIKKKLDIYYLFRDFLKEVYSDLERRKIVDVGAGLVPQFGRELAKISKEDVISVDRNISKINVPKNLIVKREIFNMDTDIGDRNLIVGIHPCEATYDMISKAAENNVDFAIMVCGCTYQGNDPYSQMFGWNDFVGRVNDIVEESSLGKLYTSRINVSPIIYTKK